LHWYAEEEEEEEEEEEVYLCNTQHTIYRHAYNMRNIRIAIKCCKQYNIKVSKSDLIKAQRACKV